MASRQNIYEIHDTVQSECDKRDSMSRFLDHLGHATAQTIIERTQLARAAARSSLVVAGEGVKSWQSIRAELDTITEDSKKGIEMGKASIQKHEMVFRRLQLLKELVDAALAMETVHASDSAAFAKLF